MHLTHPSLHSRNLGPDPKIPVLSESSSVTLNDCSFQGTSFTGGNKSGSFYISGSFFLKTWEASSISHIWHIVQLLLLPESRTCKHRPQVRARNISSSAPNFCQSQRMIDQSWALNSDHLRSYEMLKRLPSALLKKKKTATPLFGSNSVPLPSD